MFSHFQFLLSNCLLLVVNVIVSVSKQQEINKWTVRSAELEELRYSA